jgi:hypothetical protein
MSSTVSVATSTSGIWRISVSIGSSAGAVFPSTGTTLSCGSIWVKNEATRSWKPFKTLSTMMSAIDPSATPITEMSDITLMALVDFFEKR